MSKGLTFFLGIVTGVLLTFGICTAIYYSKNHGDEGVEMTKEEKAKLPEGMTKLDEPIPFTEARNFKILQVVFNDAALANSEKKFQYSHDSYYTDPVVLIVADQANTFYDDQIVKAPNDCKVMQVGTFKYESGLGWRTVPVIRFVKE